jgi:signal transduction histidine kinase
MPPFRMNALPRFLATALFVLLAALVALLAAPVWRARSTGSVDATTNQNAPANGTSNNGMTARVAALPQQLALLLAAISAAVALSLLVSLARSRPGGESRAPFATVRHEMGALSKLAETSVAQGAALDRERHDRQRAEEDVAFKQQLLSHSLEERIRLGHDLHDGIIQSLYAVGLTLESVRTLAATDPAEADRRLAQCLSAINGTIRDVRAYITGLTPDSLRKAGFAQALDNLIGELRGSREVKFEVRVDDDATALLSPDQSTDALQIAREAISNSLRHGRATSVTVRLHKSDREVCLLVQDNGVGFEASRRSSGHGLGNMQARAQRIGAVTRVESRPGAGTRVVVTLPVLQPSS